MKSCGIHLRVSVQRVAKVPFSVIGLNTKISEWLSYFPGVHELKYIDRSPRLG